MTNAIVFVQETTKKHAAGPGEWKFIPYKINKTVKHIKTTTTKTRKTLSLIVRTDTFSSTRM